MFYVGQKINSWTITEAELVDGLVFAKDVTHAVLYLVEISEYEWVVVILPAGESSKNIMRKGIEKELLRIHSYQGKAITI